MLVFLLPCSGLENEVLPDLMAKTDEVKEQLEKHEKTAQDKMDDIPVLKQKMQRLIQDLEKYGTDVAHEREKVTDLHRQIGKLENYMKKKESDQMRAVQELRTQLEAVRSEQAKQSQHLKDEMRELREWKEQMAKQHGEELRKMQDKMREERMAREAAELARNAAERQIQEMKERDEVHVKTSQDSTEQEQTPSSDVKERRTTTEVTQAGASVPGRGVTRKTSSNDPQRSLDLYAACCTGDLDMVKSILRLNQADINFRGRRSRTPLMEAARRGHRDVVELLVEQGADVSLVDDVGDSFLHLACQGGDYGTVKRIVSLNLLDINCRGGRSRTPLMEAARRGHMDVVELLVTEGADVSLVDDGGNNILHVACGGGDVGVVEFVLLMNVVDINSRNDHRQTAAGVARDEGHGKVVDLLVSRVSIVMNHPRWLADARQNLRKVDMKDENEIQGGRPGTTPQFPHATVPKVQTMTVAATTGTHARTDTAIAAGVVHGAVGSNITNVVYKDTEEALQHNLRKLENKLKIHQRQLCDTEANIQKLEKDVKQQQDNARLEDRPNVENQIGHLKEEIKVHKSEIARLEYEVLPDLMAKRDEVKEQLEKHEKTAQDKMDDIPVLKRKMERLIQDLENYGTDVANEREKVKDLYWQIGKLEKDIKKKESDQMKTVQELRTEMETFKSEHAKQVEQSQHLKDEMRELREWKEQMAKQQDEQLREVQNLLKEERIARKAAEKEIQELRNRDVVDVKTSPVPGKVEPQSSQAHTMQQGTGSTVSSHLTTSTDHKVRDEAEQHGEERTARKAAEKEILKNRDVVDVRASPAPDKVEPRPPKPHSMQMGTSSTVSGHVASGRGHKVRGEAEQHGASQKTSLTDTAPSIATLLGICRDGDVDKLRVVLGQGRMNLNRGGVTGDTPVIVAADKGQKDVVELLVREGADVSRVNDVGNNALHVACRGGHVDVAEFILSLNRVDVNSRGWRSRTPLMEAAANGRREVVELLMKEGADVSLRDDDGNNTFHLACVGEHLEVAEFLLSLNVVDVHARNNYRQTAYSLARFRGHQQVMEFLVSRGAR
ncbi:ankyrin repeat domain-containing protein 17-like [Haliotis asinina]|uniref:ankyrin repeat domain-containing protein 17-like n=1 Tax=Haliotis asinina TaxID=109174 RepID=UPI003531D916